MLTLQSLIKQWDIKEKHPLSPRIRTWFQGSLLCPLRLIIYVYDTTLSTAIEVILNNINNSDVESKINLELACINDWLKCNKLSLNITKSKCMIFHTPQKKVELNIENRSIDKVYGYNFLGLAINEHFNCKRHIDKLAMGVLKQWVSLTELNMFFFSMLR